MPWKEFLVSEARVQFVLAWQSKSEPVASLSRGFGISRKTAYKWLKRYRAGGVKALEDASRRPHHRSKTYHFCWRERLRRARRRCPDWGAKKLRWGLKKEFPRARRIPGRSTLARWLAECHLVKKRKRRARPGPVLPGRGVRAAQSCNEVWTIDFKGWFRTGDGWRCEPLTVRDLHSRFVLGVALLNNQSDTEVRRALAKIFRRYGLPKGIRVDNGAPFGGTGALGLSRLSVWWMRLGIRVDFIRPAHPQDNAAHEQLHRVLKAKVATPPAPSRAAQRRRVRAWIASYNQERPHEALGQQVPAHLYRPSARRMPSQLEEAKYRPGGQVRRVRNRGHIKWQGHQRFIGRAFVGERVGLNKTGDGTHEVYLESQLIGLLYDRETTGMRPASIARPI